MYVIYKIKYKIKAHVLKLNDILFYLIYSFFIVLRNEHKKIA